MFLYVRPIYNNFALINEFTTNNSLDKSIIQQKIHLIIGWSTPIGYYDL